MLQKPQSGRSMLEMIAVLAITGLIIISGIFLFHHLFQRYQDNETTKEMNELITRYRSDRLTRRRNGRVVIKDLIPEARTKNSDTMITANNGTLQLEDNSDKGTFVIIGKDLGFSCQDILLQGNYDGVLDEGEEVLSPDEIKKQNIEQLKALCKKEELKFIFNREGETCNYYIDGECSECKSGESMALLPEGGNGCCRTNSINECGYCEKCPDHKQCNTETKKCGECIDTCPGKQVCDDGVCVDCTQDSDCQAADMHCTNLKKCEKCDSRFQEWVNGICVCKKIRPQLNEACSSDCGCQGGLDCINGTCQEGQCINEPEKTHWNGVECVCPAPKTWYNEGKCKCPLGTTEQGGDCVPTLGATCPNLGKGEACSNYSAFPNNCCGVGLSCRNGKCQCNAIPTTYGAECSIECGCGIISGFECNAATNKCDCPADKPFWDGSECVKCLLNTDCANTQYCDSTEKVCKECSGSGNSCQKCEAGSWVADSSKNNEACGTCGTCNNGICNDTGMQSYTYNKLVNGVCTSVTESFCPANAPSDQCELSTSCSGTPTNDCFMCNETTKQWVVNPTKIGTACSLCTFCGDQKGIYNDKCECVENNQTCVGCNECQKCDTATATCVEDTSKNNTSCGTCGTCSNGTCNEEPKQSYTYKKLVNDVCTSVTEEFCPTNAPTDQCSENCTGGRVWNGTECVCPDGMHWDDITQKCLPCCKAGDEFGLVFVLDRSHSTEDKVRINGVKYRYYQLITQAATQLYIPDNIKTAIYISYGKGNPSLSYGYHSNSSITSIFNNQKRHSGSNFSATFEAAKNLCSKNGKIILFMWSDGAIKGTSSLKTKCPGSLFYFVGPANKCPTGADRCIDIKSLPSSYTNTFNKKIQEEACVKC